MEAQSPQFTGVPCGQYKSHTFYSGFKYSNKQGKCKNLKLGDFFFVRISAEEDPCIGELQLLCSNRNNDQQLSALRLYFLPEQTPEGRLAHHGEDEVLVASDRVVLKLDDLVSWITEEVEWNHGIVAPRPESSAPSPPSSAPSEVSSDDTIVIKKEEKDEQFNDDNNNDTSSSTLPSRNSTETESNPAVDEGDCDKKKATDVKEENVRDIATQDDESKDTKVLVLSYQSYCRYRTILRRLDGGDPNEWLQNDMVLALGGFAPPSNKTHVLFCRDMFEHDELAHHELNCEYLAPVLKAKRKKKKPKNARSTSPESIASEEIKDLIKNNQKANGLKQPPVKNEQEFLQRLFKFMKKRNTPIHRVPHLGFKQIDLYVFYSFAQKLGGYDNITGKKLWKHVYDELGGNPGSTSAATCTRRHYERLLLPFERFMAGIVYKPAQRGKKSVKKSVTEEEKTDGVQVKTEPASDTANETNANPVSTEVEDAYAFTDSNQENSNSKDSNSNEFNSACEELPLANEPVFSDEDSKTIWSIQKQPDAKDDVDKDDNKAIKPLIIQVRQSRSSSRGCKTPVPDGSPANQDKVAGDSVKSEDMLSQPPLIKSETIEPIVEKNIPALSTPPKLTVNNEISHTSHSNKLSSSKFLPPNGNPSVKVKNEPKKRGANKETSAGTPNSKKFSPPSSKTGYQDNRAKSWCNYPINPDQPHYQSTAYPGMDNYVPAHLRGQAPTYYKVGSRSEPDITRDHLMHSGRLSVGSMSASSVVSAEASATDEKLTVPQRRPSVIQHTEYAATSPSPSLSPKQSNPEINQNVGPKEGLMNVPFSSPKMNLLPNQPGYSTTGKVAEWLTKGVHEVVACKTPTTAIEKTMELHDKVMMPSSCKTPGAVGTSKVPVNNVKGKHSSTTNSSKSPRSKYSSSHRHRNSDSTNGNFNPQSRASMAHQKSLHPSPVAYNNSVMSNASGIPKGAAKYHHQTIHSNMKQEFYPNVPYYNQPKRHKINNIVPTMLPPVNPSPSPSPFVRQQTYVTPPMSDLPKTTASTHNDYEYAVLDLSVKKKSIPAPRPRTPPPPVPLITSIPEEGVCLDLSVKKKSNASTDNGIENITPPLPLSPNPSSQQTTSYMHSSLKPLPTLLALQDLAAEEALRRNYSSDRRSVPPVMSTPPVSGPPIGMPPATMFPGSTHSKMPPGLMNSIPPGSYSKDIAKNMYMPSNARHSQFSPYVIPPFFPSNWPSVVNTSSPSVKQTNSNSQTSPMGYKGMVNHSVFPKDYPYNVKSQYHPVLCKDSGRYPSNGK
ncbi:AT-rich interactive domain-containing protein 5B isoform X2 [Parasteatoda tepidariorum]|uniref:AT-rich interactive domain-containing protein 5B isoform X2 n=1 Tax=Parasteatoda tepidariorum TaxID=114398 RepID=UPI00077FCE61|nr:AT-rich interactive domain-containing protein 5B isoform X2 [Parasteatoda tepidariorum]